MLPYKDLEEVKAAFGRDPTVAETLWFNYSAKKPDYILHCHNIVFLLLFYSVVPLAYVLLELCCSKNMDKFKIQPKAKKSFSHIFTCYKHVVWTFLLLVGPLLILSYPAIKWVGIRTSLALPSKWEILWQLLVYFVVEDYTHYWLHRLLHSKWAYQNIHRVHHEFTAPMGLAALYSHWAEFLILGFPAFLGPAMVPGHILTYWLWFILRQIEAIETHSGYEFPWSPSKYIPFYGGAEHHDYHHFVGQRSHSNFAPVFTYCDYIYRTDKGYCYQKYMVGKSKEELRSNGEQSGDTQQLKKFK